MRPPYKITPKILSLVADLMKQLGRLEGMTLSSKSSPELRRQNRIQTIYSTLAIEGNTLSLDQVSAVIDDQRVLGPPKDILEVSNAVRLYDELNHLDCSSKDDFLRAHGILMKELVSDAGTFRKGGVGIQKGQDIIHIAPPADILPGLINDLFGYIQSDEDHILIQSCVLHYELEFIHPFSDGNGRMGRFWQSLKLSNLSEVFEYLPIESVIKEHQIEYYKVLSICDKAGDSTAFIEFMLNLIYESLKRYEKDTELKPLDAFSRLQKAREFFGPQSFVRKDYLELFSPLSTATASRDLKKAVVQKILIIQGSGRMTKYSFNP